MSKKYELLIILTPELSENEVNSELDTIKQNLIKEGGEVTFEDYWGKQRFAYPIKKFENGHYYFLEFSYDPQKIAELEKELTISKDVLRQLVTIAPDGYQQKKHQVIKEEMQEEMKKLEKPKKFVPKKPNDSRKFPKKEDNNTKDETNNKVDKSQLDAKLDKILGADLNI